MSIYPIVMGKNYVGKYDLLAPRVSFFALLTGAREEITLDA